LDSFENVSEILAGQNLRFRSEKTGTLRFRCMRRVRLGRLFSLFVSLLAVFD